MFVMKLLINECCSHFHVAIKVNLFQFAIKFAQHMDTWSELQWGRGGGNKKKTVGWGYVMGHTDRKRCAWDLHGNGCCKQNNLEFSFLQRILSVCKL